MPNYPVAQKASFQGTRVCENSLCGKNLSRWNKYPVCFACHDKARGGNPLGNYPQAQKARIKQWRQL